MKVRLSEYDTVDYSLKEILKHTFCTHKEEELVQHLRMPWGYSKSLWRCKKCGKYKITY